MNKRISLQIAISAWKKIARVLLGLVLFLVLLEAGMRFGGFVLLSIQEFGNLRSAKQKGVYRILCIGESTTQGQYPYLLEQVLNQRNIGVHFSVIDKGRPGVNTLFIMNRVESYLAEYRPDMVVAMMGINDKSVRYYQDIPESDAWLFRHCRVYRFGRILYMHLLKKIKQEDIYGSNKVAPDKKNKPRNAETAAEKTDLLNEMPAEEVAKSDLTGAEGSPGPRGHPRSRSMLFEAEESLKKTDPQSDEAYVELGRLYQEQGEFLQAENSFKKAIALDPKNDKACVRLGRLYLDQNKFSQAEDFFKKTIEINPKNDKACVDLGELYRVQGKFLQAGDLFKKAIALNPENDEAYVRLGTLYREHDKFLQAEDLLRKAIELDPKNDRAYVGLGWLFRSQGDFHLAEGFLRKAIELNPKNDGAHLELERLHREQGKFLPAGDSFKKAIESNPKNNKAYAGLEWLFREQGNFPKAEDFLRKAIELNPENANAYVELGWLYRDQGEFSQAEDFLRKAIELDPKSDRVCVRLGWLYREQGKFSQAENFLRKAIELNPKNERVLGALSSLYEEMGKPELAKEYAEKANRLRSENYAAVTVNNYRELKEILDRKGIKLVCVQYPVRHVGPLKRIFEKDKGVIFVDNERAFKEVLKKSGYKEYFKDMFGGDFGHCTRKGNMLLAQNIADVILREVFEK